MQIYTVCCSLKVYMCIRYQNANLDPVLSIVNLDPIDPTATPTWICNILYQPRFLTVGY